jgi:hypothetical protein
MNMNPKILVTLAVAGARAGAVLREPSLPLCSRRLAAPAPAVAAPSQSRHREPAAEWLHRARRRLWPAVVNVSVQERKVGVNMPEIWLEDGPFWRFLRNFRGQMPQGDVPMRGEARASS